MSALQNILTNVLLAGTSPKLNEVMASMRQCMEKIPINHYVSIWDAEGNSLVGGAIDGGN